MKEEEIKRLVKIVEESNIAEIEITESRWGKSTIKISKNSSVAANSSTHIIQAPIPSAPLQPVVPEPAAASATSGADTKPASTGTEIKSPMVGTFYRSPAPDADPYVEIGTTVKKGQVLCIIEAMKLMNEIESDANGKIVQILVESGQPVEYNQALFVIEPA